MATHIHILGICGTFMGGLAQLAQAQGYRVTGSDSHVYPPMSTQLKRAGIQVYEGYDCEQLDPAPDLVVVGNALSRGNPAVEAVLDRGIPYVSGPQWLGEQLLADKWVLAVSGTHGKTTTTSILAWLLDYAGMKPGFLVGGVPENFGLSARLGESDFFVIEADEYDTAFFDKRSKFVHYRPRTVVLGNLEFDHGDIFPDLAAIERQFHQLIRCVPGNGQVIRPTLSEAFDRVLALGVWTPVVTFDSVSDESDWQFKALTPAGESFQLRSPSGAKCTVSWSMLGSHNLANACAAAAAAHHVGVPLAVIGEGLATFSGVKRRLELRGKPNGVAVYDDFAHHPTAIACTLETLSLRGDEGRLIAVIELRSNSMRAGFHAHELPDAIRHADQVFWYQSSGLDDTLERILGASSTPSEVVADIHVLTEKVATAATPGDAVVIMSNGGFSGFHELILTRLAASTPPTGRG